MADNFIGLGLFFFTIAFHIKLETEDQDIFHLNWNVPVNRRRVTHCNSIGKQLEIDMRNPRLNSSPSIGNKHQSIPSKSLPLSSMWCRVINRLKEINSSQDSTTDPIYMRAVNDSILQDHSEREREREGVEISRILRGMSGTKRTWRRNRLSVSKRPPFTGE